MSTFETMKARKSVRSYQAKAVEPEKIKAIVEAGNMAAGTPMAGKVYFSVITNAEVLQSIVAGAKAVMAKSGVPMLEKISANPNFNPIYGAPVAVVISTDKADIGPGSKDNASKISNPSSEVKISSLIRDV